MTTFWQFVVIGLGAGAVYALLSLGVVTIYRVSGVVTLAQGGFAVMAGFLYAPLIQSDGWSFGPALGAIVIGGGLVGAGVYWLAIRPLRNASLVTQVMATLAVLLIIQGVATIMESSSTVTVMNMLPAGVFDIRGVVVSYSVVTLVGIAVGLTGILWLGSRFTLAGVASRAVAENPIATAAAGWSPDLLGTFSWAIGSALGAAAGILIAPTTGVSVSNMTLLTVAALTPALAAGFSSFPITLLGALFIGVAQAEVENYTTITGASDAVPFLVLVLVIALRGHHLPLRGFVAEKQAMLGTGRIEPRVVVPALAAIVLLVSFTNDPNLIAAITASLAFAAIMLSIVVLTGYTGQLSFGQAAFAGIGALITARLIHSAGFSFLPAALIAIVASVLIGVLFALPALRTRGMTLAIVTLGLGVAVSNVLFVNGSVISGILGTEVGPQSLLGWGIDPASHPVRYALLCIFVLSLCMFAVANLRRGRVGRRMIAVRANERAAVALGVNVYAVKLYAFGLAAAIAAIGGVLVAFQFDTIDYTQFSPFVSALAIGYAVIGGIGSVFGPLLASPLAPGGLGTWIFEQIGGELATYLPLIGGVGLLMMLLTSPDGQANALVKLVNMIRRRRSKPDLEESSMVPELAALEDLAVERVRPVRLSVDDLAVHFGGVRAVDGVSLTLEPGRISGVIGPNGAGKTTLIDAITGFVRPTRGTIALDGRRVDGWAAYKRARAGVSRSFQGLELFEGSSVAENLLSASEEQDAGGYFTTLVRPGRREFTSAAVAAIRDFRLEDDLAKLPSELSYAKRRLVAIARAVATNPSVLLLDEPVAGLDDVEVREIAVLIRGLATNWGMSILVVEHDMNFVMSTCDDITVVDFGKQIAYGKPAEVSSDPKVVAAYLGELEEDLVGGAA